MNDPLRNALVIEMRDLFAKKKNFQKRRPAGTGLERVLIVRKRDALVGGQRGVPAPGKLVQLASGRDLRVGVGSRDLFGFALY